MRGHAFVVADRFAIFPDLPVPPLRYPAAQFEFAGNHRPREITFADKIRHDVNLADRRVAEEKKRIAKARLFFPETAGDVREDSTTANRGRVPERRSTRRGIYGRAVADDQEGGISLFHNAKGKRPTFNVQRPTSN